MPEIVVAKSQNQLPTLVGNDYALWQGDTELLLAALPAEPLFDLIITSPPYNLGKSYEKKATLEDYLTWQERIIDLVVPRLAQTGSLCGHRYYVDMGGERPVLQGFADRHVHIILEVFQELQQAIPGFEARNSAFGGLDRAASSPLA